MAKIELPAEEIAPLDAVATGVAGLRILFYGQAASEVGVIAATDWNAA